MPLSKISLITGLLLSALLGPLQAQITGVHRELYLNLSRDGFSLGRMTNHPNFLAGRPDQTNTLANLQSETSRGDDYGQRLRGYLTAPSTGSYTFEISADETANLLLSTNENPAFKRLIAWVDPRSQENNFTTHYGQLSAPIPLQAGQRYYFEVLHHDVNLIDHLAVRWQIPGGALESPIPNARLVYEMAPLLATNLTDLALEEGRAAVFEPQMANFLPQSYRWQRHGADIPGATNRSYVLPVATLADNGALFRAFITNRVGATNTLQVQLTVLPDTSAPSVVSVLNANATNVFVIFSEPVAAASALAVANYSLPGATVLAAEFGADAQTVILTTSPLTLQSSYTLAISNILDRASAPNALVGTQVVFTAREFNPQTVGALTPPGSVIPVGAGAIITGGGADIGGPADQFQFAWQSVAGDFDFRVRVETLDGTEVWARAGLMARETLDADSRFAAAFASPTLAGAFFQHRTNTGGLAASSGAYPPSFPSMWLRLQRAGSLFSGFASQDGENWMPLGSVSVALSNRIYFGFAVGSHHPSQTATAQFRDFAPASGGTIGVVPPRTEPLGPSSRRTGLAISEIMYHPREVLLGTNQAELEFVELFNSNPFFEDVSGYRLSGDIEFTFPAGTILPGGGFMVVARHPSDAQTVYGITGVFGPFTNNLPNDQGRIRLRNQNDFVLLEVNYAAKYPWPVAADGAGHSLVLARPSYGENQREAWAASDRIGGSPGRLEPVSAEPLRALVINEFLAHSDAPTNDFIELHNRSGQPLDLGGAWLTDNPATNKFRLPSPTTIAAHGFVSFDQSQLGFSLSSSGERVFFVNSNQTRVIDALGFDAQANSVSSGRFPDGAPGFRELAVNSPGTANAPPLGRDIVINEIMYHPISENSDDEFLELFNKGTNALNLGGWHFTGGISFNFSSNTVIAAGGYLVVARNVTNLVAHYGNLNFTNLVGNYDGSLANSGERLALVMRQSAIDADDPMHITTNTIRVVVNEVEYRRGGQWGKWADGGGSSLELIDPRADHRLAPNWADSDETAKAPWTTIETTGVLDNGGDTANALHALLLEEGECLLDDVEVMQQGGGNLIANSNFESGLTGWTIRGNHERSSLENTGYTGSRSLHVRATSRGDTGPNKLHVPLTSSLANGQTATIRAKVRWLRGWPEILLRLRGSYLEATDRLIVPLNLGTPGAQNSRYTNAGPAITEVTHTPAVPAANQPVVVTARVVDPDGLSSLVVRYRVDPVTNLTNVVMTDMGEGVFAATIPGQAADKVVAFIIEATDAALTPAAARFPATRDDNGRTRECLVHFGSPILASGFGTYRFWITGASITNWSQREVLSNERIPGTFVYGNQRVIYGAGARYSGSSAHQDMGGPDYSPVGTPNHYAFDMPGDDLLLGTDNFNKIHGAGNNHHDDNTLQRELVAYSVAAGLGLPVNYKRSVAMFINGARRGSLMEDTQVPNGDTLESVFPDDADGDLFKISIWNEFGLTGQALATTGISEAYLNNYTTTGGAKKRARYRWNFAQRSIHGTANDFTNLYTLVNAVTAPASPAFAPNLNAIADVENWMRSFAVEHAVGNWDSFGYRNHQNMFAYKPEHGRWSLLIWDINIVFGGGTRGAPIGTNGDLVEIDSTDTGISAIYNQPEFRRAYWRGLKDVTEGPFLNARADPPMDARFAAYSASGVNVDAPDYLKVWISQRRAYILSELAKIDPANFTLGGPGAFTSPTNLVPLSGVAPIGVRTIEVNGIAWPVTWTTLTNWTLRVPLSSATNQLTVIGLDGRGQPVAGASNQVTVTYTGPLPQPQGSVVINELMHSPRVADAEYIEFFNTSSNLTFDVSGWRVNGLDYIFPDGSYLAPRSFLVLAKNRSVFGSAYGNPFLVFDEFTGDFQRDGETISLIKPGANPVLDLIVDRVRYEGAMPWPAAAADGTGSSYQLIDANQDNSRAGNWFANFVPAVSTPAVSTPAMARDGWRFFSTSGSIGTGEPGTAAMRLLVYLGEGGSAIIDDLSIVAGTNAGVGPTNYVSNGDFEAPLVIGTANTNLSYPTNAWFLGTNYTNSLIIGDLVHAGAGALKIVGGTAGSANPATYNRAMQQFLFPPPAINSTNTLSFWYWATNSATNLYMRIRNSTFLTTATNSGPTNINIFFTPSNYVPPVLLSPATNSLTPGVVNQGLTNLPAFQPLWINEVQAENLTGILDNHGEREPWIEIYNASTNSVPLEGLFLTSTYTNLTNWAFPAGSSLGATQFLVVFCDGQAVQTSNTEYHTSFRLPAASGALALSRIHSNTVQVIDYLNYAGVHAGRSYGSFPDGQSFERREFFYVTPGGTNDGRIPPIVVSINEWMAQNSSTLADPADGNYEDWFELYNPGPNEVDLAGYFLTDVLTNKFQFQITTNMAHIIPPHGYLLVWADNEEGQNTVAGAPRPDLHVNFALSVSGDSIGLFAPDGTPIDAVTFFGQPNDISMGLYPDGAANLYFFSGTVTPRAANQIATPPNTPPVLDPIGDNILFLGQSLAFTATARDFDVPAQSLTFTLDPVPPVGANIAGTGAFTWTPAAVGTNTITVRVTDNGSPALDASETITVEVLAAPGFTTSLRNGDNVELTWRTRAGKKYAVDSKDDLNTVPWTPLWTNLALGDTLSFTNATTNGPQQFYRIRTVE